MIDFHSLVFKAAAETDETGSMIGCYVCQNPVTVLPV